MATRGSFGVGPQGPAGNSTGAAGGDLGGNFPNPTLAATANVESIIRANRLDQMAAPTAAVSLGGQKLTNVANGVLATDVMTIGQIPAALPAIGPAGGDLSGTYPNPSLASTSNVNSVVRLNSLDQMAAPQASVSMNNQRTINQAAGISPADGAIVAQLPTVQLLAAGVSTGMISGGVLSIGADLQSVDISAYSGYVVDYTVPTAPIITLVKTTNTTHVPLTVASKARFLTFFIIDSTGTITQIGTTPTPQQRRQYIVVGACLYDQTALQVQAVQNITTAIAQPLEQLYDLLESLGPFSISGNEISANGANLHINQAAGTMFSSGFNYTTDISNPHVHNTISQTPATFRYGTSVGSFGALTTTIDPGHYDVGGVITIIPGGVNTATIQRIWLAASTDATAQIAIQYGTVAYTSLTNAIAAVGGSVTPTNPSLPGNAALIGYLCVIKNATDLSNTAQASFIPAAKFAV